MNLALVGVERNINSAMGNYSKDFMPKVTPVSVGLIINQKKEILIASRISASLLPHSSTLWEFPGGKIEPGETAYQALCRELKEEVNISVTKAIPFNEIQHIYAENQAVLLHFFSVLQWSGDATGLEKQELKWILLKDLHRWNFPEANREIIERLQR